MLRGFQQLGNSHEREFMAELRKQEGLAARALEFVILTATRTSKVTGARWNEFNLSTGTSLTARRRLPGKRRRMASHITLEKRTIMSDNISMSEAAGHAR